jgi:hypothetical protein
MGVQIPCNIYPEMPVEDIVQGTKIAFGEIFRRLTVQKESQIEEGLLPSVSSAINFLQLRLFDAAWICLLPIFPRRIPSFSAVRRMSLDTS